jgi:uncharacterized membrane protein YcaP (DUF421 family)
VNLVDLYAFHVSPLELFVRGSAIYLFLFLLFRFVLRRDVGAIGIADVLLVVLIADAAQNAMSGGYTTVSEGMVLVATIAGWNWGIDWAAFHSDRVARFVIPPPLELVRHGRMRLRNLRAEHMSPAELMSKLRSQGVEDLSDVRVARLEPDGEISVIRAVSEPAGRRSSNAGRSQRP